MLDVELLAQVYLELLGGKQPGLELVAKSTGTSGVVLKRQPATPRPVALPSRLSDDERSRHDALIASLGDKAIWKN